MIFQFRIIRILFKSKDDLVLETIELRQQLAAYKANKENPENIIDLTLSLLIALKSTWPKWMDAFYNAGRKIISRLKKRDYINKNSLWL